MVKKSERDFARRERPTSPATNSAMLSTCQGLGFGVLGVGCGIWGVGCGVWDVGCGLWGVGFGVWGLGFRV